MIDLYSGQVVYYARCLKSVNEYEVLELTLRTVKNTYVVGIDSKTKHGVIINTSDFGKTLFVDRKTCLKTIKDIQKHSKTS